MRISTGQKEESDGSHRARFGRLDDRKRRTLYDRLVEKPPKRFRRVLKQARQAAPCKG